MAAEPEEPPPPSESHIEQHRQDVALDAQREKALFWRVFWVMVGIGGVLAFRTWMLMT